MVTLVGTQENFTDALKELIELEYAETDAYEEAVERLEAPTYKEKLIEFRADHERHIKEISALLKKNNHEIPQKGTVGKRLITTGKVILANIVGDNTILQAIKSNETDANMAYERINNHKGKWPEARELIKRGLQDGRRHRAWLETTLS